MEGDAGTLTLERNGLRMTLAARRAGDQWVFDDLKSLDRLEPEEPVEAAGAAAAPDARVAFNIVGGQGAFGGGVAVINGRVIQLGNAQVRMETQVPAVTNDAPVTVEQRGEIEKLVRDLGAADAEVRARARAKLRELGPAAHGVLKEHRNDTDVEVATTVRELLGE